METVVQVGTLTAIDDAEAALDPADLAMDRCNGLLTIVDLPGGLCAADGAACAIELMSGSDVVLQLIQIGDAQGQSAHERPRNRTTGLLWP
ncbi:hypothetical protein D3C77_739810 [compost metagenome]